jgi:hypothetical protein
MSGKSLTPFATGNELVRCGCCGEYITDVAPQETEFMTIQMYPERFNRELNTLVCESCWKGLRDAGAWLKSAQMPHITKAEDER